MLQQRESDYILRTNNVQLQAKKYSVGIYYLFSRVLYVLQFFSKTADYLHHLLKTDTHNWKDNRKK